MWSTRIVGYSISHRMTAELAEWAFRNAIALRDPIGTVVRYDRGSQFRSKALVSKFKSNQLTGSMGRVGACGDNAAMDSIFALLQKNVLDRQRWTSREQLCVAIMKTVNPKSPPNRGQSLRWAHPPSSDSESWASVGRG